jgi:hypothetical protein
MHAEDQADDCSSGWQEPKGDLATSRAEVISAGPRLGIRGPTVSAARVAQVHERDTNPCGDDRDRQEEPVEATRDLMSIAG